MEATDGMADEGFGGIGPPGQRQDIRDVALRVVLVLQHGPGGNKPRHFAVLEGHLDGEVTGAGITETPVEKIAVPFTDEREGPGRFLPELVQAIIESINIRNGMRSDRCWLFHVDIDQPVYQIEHGVAQKLDPPVFRAFHAQVKPQVRDLQKRGEIQGQQGKITSVRPEENRVSRNAIAEFDSARFSENIALFYEPVQ